MELDEVLNFTKNAIRKNVAKWAYKDEVVLVKALEMIETYQAKNECAGCEHYGGMVPDCMAPALTPCPKEQPTDTASDAGQKGKA